MPGSSIKSAVERPKECRKRNDEKERKDFNEFLIKTSDREQNHKA